MLCYTIQNFSFFILCVDTANSCFIVVRAAAHTREAPVEFSEILDAL
jgi:hypothetical protein